MIFYTVLIKLINIVLSFFLCFQIYNKQAMEIVLLNCRRRLIQLLLASTLLVLISIQSTNCELTSVCGMVSNVTVEVKYEGCEPLLVKLRTCSGACLSSMESINIPPYQKRTCNSCRPTQWRVKPRRFTFTCDGVQVTHRLYYPVIDECGCVDCSPRLG